MFAGFGITVTDTAQKVWALFSFGAGQANGLVGSDTGFSQRGAALYNRVTSVLLLPGDEVNTFVIQVVIPYVIGITSIEDDDTATRQR